MGGLLTACQAIMSSHFGAGYASNVSRDLLAPNPQGDLQPGQSPYLWIVEEDDAELDGELANGLAFLTVRVKLQGVILRNAANVNSGTLQKLLNNWQGALFALLGPTLLGTVAAEVMPGGILKTYVGEQGGAIEFPLSLRFNVYA